LAGIDGIKIIKRTANGSMQPSFVMCSTDNDPDFVDAASCAGARGYVLKSRIGIDLILAVKMVARGERFVSPLNGNQGFA
jgi:DNA-binding NarL/FixJ family response regulator